MSCIGGLSADNLGRFVMVLEAGRDAEVRSLLGCALGGRSELASWVDTAPARVEVERTTLTAI